MSDVPGRLLRETLQAGMMGESPGCLDAETVARFADGALTRSERAAVEAHAARCARCQSLLAAMARTAPLAIGRAWFRSPIVAWAAPLTAVVAALLIYVQVVPRSQQASPPSAAPQTNLARATANTATPEERRISPSGERQEGQAGQAVRAHEATEADHAAAARSLAKGERDDRRAAVDKALPTDTQPLAMADQDKKASVGPPAVMAEAIAPAPAPPAASPSSPAAATPPPPSPPALPGAAASPVAAVPPPPAARPTARPAAKSADNAVREESPARSNEARGFALALRTPASVIVIPSSTASTRWRVISTVVQRSTDSGATWQDTQPTGASMAPTAGASPSPLVCWLVGPQGLVLLSTDGRSWKRIGFPETVDLTSIEATDDKTATITALNGRTFKTTDGGQAWTRP